MPSPCAARCALPAVDVGVAGLRLDLCIVHLSALRRMCQGKERWPYAKLAAHEAERLVDAGASHRPGRTPTAYQCALCGSWHVGHQENDGDGHPADAAAAAAAVRARLTSGQLNHLCTAWRPGVSRRPARRRRRTP